MKDNEIIELYWERNEAAITATAETYGSYCHTISYNILHCTKYPAGLPGCGRMRQ